MKDLIEDLIVEVLAASAKIGVVCGAIYCTAYALVGWF